MGWVFTKNRVIGGKELWKLNKELYLKDNSLFILEKDYSVDYYHISMSMENINESTMRFFTKHVDKLTYINYSIDDYKQLLLTLGYTPESIGKYDLMDAEIEYRSGHSYGEKHLDEKDFYKIFYYLEIWNKETKEYEKIEIKDHSLLSTWCCNYLRDGIYKTSITHVPTIWYKEIEYLGKNSMFKGDVFDFVNKAVGRKTLSGRYFNSFRNHIGKKLNVMGDYNVIIDEHNIDLFKDSIEKVCLERIEPLLNLEEDEFILGSY